MTSARIAGPLLLAAVLCSCRSTHQEGVVLPRSWATGAALAHFRKTNPPLAKHLTNLGDPKMVTGPRGTAWLVSLYDMRYGNPSYMLPDHVEVAFHRLIILGPKGAPIVISGKKQIVRYQKIPAIDPSKPGMYERGDWKYDCRLEQDNSANVIGHWGYLYRAGKLVDKGARPPRGRKIETPWGPMYYWKYPLMPRGPHGWLPFDLSKEYLERRNEKGQPLYRFRENETDFQQRAEGNAEGVTIENGFVTSIGDTRLATPMLPGRNDRKVATALDAGVREAGLSYLRKRRGNERFTLTDARRVGDFFLLWYAAQDVDDAYENLVYSVKAKKIVGRFRGYIGG